MRKPFGVLFVATTLASGTAWGAIFTVTKVADTSDGLCDADCSLREAIAASNAAPGADAIHFALGGAGPFVIGVVGQLPPLDDSVTIDGYSQSGSAPNTSEVGSNAVIQIEVRDVSGIGIGLALCAPDITIRGLSVTDFGFAALHTSSNGPQACAALGSNLKIEGNFLGLEPDGVTVRANLIGVVVSGATTLVGGTDLAQRNLISGNGAFGVLFEGSSLAGSRALGNFIGTDRSGLLDRGNGDAAVKINAADDIAIGSIDAPNVIAYNGRGSHVAGFSQRADVALNRYFANGALGIDLSAQSQADGVTPNDVDDVDFGSNSLQNFPELIAVDRTAGGVRVSGRLDVPVNTAAAPYRISVYASEQCDANGFGEGERLLGSAMVSFSQTTVETFVIDIDTPATLAANTFISAVATGPSGSSGFSRCMQLDAALFASGFE